MAVSGYLKNLNKIRALGQGVYLTASYFIPLSQWYNGVNSFSFDMTGGIHRLADADCKAERLSKRRLTDGVGLYLLQTRGGSKSWVFKWSEIREFVEDGKTVKRQKLWELGLGGYRSMLPDRVNVQALHILLFLMKRTAENRLLQLAYCRAR